MQKWQQVLTEGVNTQETFGAWDGKEHYWPKLPKNWEISDYNSGDAFGDWLSLDFQHFESGVIVIIDGTKAEHKGDGGKFLYSYRFMGKNMSGSFMGLSNVLKTLKMVEKEVDNILKSVKRDLEKTGWKITLTFSTFIAEKKIGKYEVETVSDDFTSMVTWNDEDTLYFRITDEYSETEKQVDVKTINDIKNALKTMEKSLGKGAK